MQPREIQELPVIDNKHQDLEIESLHTEAQTFRRASQGSEPTILANIYQEDINIAIWQRKLPETLRQSLDKFVTGNRSFQTSFTVTPQCALAGIRKSLGGTGQAELSEDIAELVDMFCCLFGLKRAGLRLTVLDRAMCPKFHVDRVPCRLVTTYRGSASQWLPHKTVDRSKLGPRNHGETDLEAGVFQNQCDIQQLGCGDVALLKGERWEGNENAGLVHRSPALPDGERRLLLTLDFCS